MKRLEARHCVLLEKFTLSKSEEQTKDETILTAMIFLLLISNVLNWLKYERKVWNYKRHHLFINPFLCLILWWMLKQRTRKNIFPTIFFPRLCQHIHNQQSFIYTFLLLLLPCFSYLQNNQKSTISNAW